MTFANLAYRADALSEIVSVKRIGDEGREEADTERTGSRERRVLSSLSCERVYRINTQDETGTGAIGDTAAAGVREREAGREEDVTARDRGATGRRKPLLISRRIRLISRGDGVGVTDSEIRSGDVFLGNAAAHSVSCFEPSPDVLRFIRIVCGTIRS